MKFTVATLGLAAVVAAAPAPLPTAKAFVPIGGEVQGSLAPHFSGFVGGTIGANGVPHGCVGGVLPNGLGATICARNAAPAPTANAKLPIGGQVHGSVGALSGFVGGTIASNGVPFGCVGGVLPNGLGATICAKDAQPTKRQIGGALGGFVGPKISGTISGEVSPTLTGFLGGIFDGKGATLFARAPEPQIGGALGGFVGPSISGTISGAVSPTLTGFLGGIFDGQGATLFARKPEAQIGGALGGFVGPKISGTLSGAIAPEITGFLGGVFNGKSGFLSGRGEPVGGKVQGSVGKLSGFVTGTVDANGVPFGCIGGVLPNGLGATLCAKNAAPAPTAAPAVIPRQVGGRLGGSVGALSGFVGGTIGTNGVPFGCIGGVLPNGEGATLCAKNAQPTA